MKTFSKNQTVTIVCYGDSNTKYYLGDLQQDGPEADSYPAKLQKLFETAGFEQVRVLNCGFPDTQTDFAIANFQQQVVDNQADICIFGFGTNCIRQPDADLEDYLDDMAHLFSLCKRRDIQPMSLLIPWFSEDYCGTETSRCWIPTVLFPVIPIYSSVKLLLPSAITVQKPLRWLRSLLLP